MSRNKHISIKDLDRIDLQTLPEDGGDEYNRLIFEKSPYLLQHATNPIDWNPWADSTLDRARKLNRPIFLSIGYSTCHWCHVMADESFTDSTVARILNEQFIPIKVDREERPDIDATYMQACQAMTGSGGWPLTLLLTPTLQPFFAATYLPKDNRPGLLGLVSLLEKIVDLWQTDRARIDLAGSSIQQTLTQTDNQPGSREPLTEDIFRQAVNTYRSRYDQIHGGFSPAPKFPAPHNLSLLFRLQHRLADKTVGDMALHSLNSIRYGGIYDQLGGGIHRYSVDERWLVPHFEKMLYDQGLLILAAIDAWQASGDPFYLEMGCDTAEYILDRLLIQEGSFCCGEDADSEGAEGTFYLWTIEQISRHFDREIVQEIVRMFGMSENGNFEEGRNILYLPEGIDADLLRNCRETLIPIRNKRPAPHLDDKIICSWNGLAIAALARLGAVSDKSRYTHAAGQAAEFIRQNLVDTNNRLLRRWRRGEAAIPGFLEDYACLIWGLIEFYQARFNISDLKWAIELAGQMLEIFGDGEGGLYDTGRDAEKVLLRGRNLQDGAFPSGNGTAALVLLRLGTLTGREEFTEQGRTLLEKNAAVINRYPVELAVSIAAVDNLSGSMASLVIVTDDEPPDHLLKVIRDSYCPGVEVLLKREGEAGLEQAVPIALGKKMIENKPTAWLCRDRTCLEPVTDPGQLNKQLLK